MAWTSADVTALERAIAAGQGARSITFADQTITFNTIDEMLKLRAVMLQELNANSGGSRTRYAATSKGV